MTACVGMRISYILEGIGGSCKPVASKPHRKPPEGLDKNFRAPHTETVLQLGSNNKTGARGTLVDLQRGDAGVLEAIDLPGDEARRLMELGFLPGMRVTAGLSAPGGDPRVFQVDGSEIALRRETARRLHIRIDKSRDM